MKRKLFGIILTTIVMVFPLLVSAEGTGSTPLAKIGEEGYGTIQEAIAAVPENGETATTIELLRSDLAVAEGIKVNGNKNFVVDFNGFTLQFAEGALVGSANTVTNNLQLLKGSTIKFVDGEMVASTDAKIFIQNYSNLTLENMVIDATPATYEEMYAVSINNGVVNIIGDTSIYSKYVAFDAYWWQNSYYAGTQVTVNTTGVVEGRIEVAAYPGSDLTESNTILNIKNVQHLGEFYIEPGLEGNVILEDGSYTDGAVTENITTPEGSDVYEVVNIETGETKYVVATEEELETKVFEDEEFFMTADEFEEALKEIEKSENEEDKEILAEIKKALEGKTTISAHNIYYGSFIGESVVTDSVQTELEKAVKVTLNIPETLEKVKDGYSRKYSVVRLHWNEDTQKMEVAVLDATENKDGTVAFETDKFSMYVLAYEDVEVKTSANPNTYDGISSIMIVACLSLISLLVVVLYVKNKKVFN